MKLIVETIENVNCIVEEVNGKKHLYIEGTYLQSERPNRNRRQYSKSLLEREVARYTKDYINQNRAWGELGHPESPSINLDRASHRILSLKLEGNDWIGKARILDTPHGRIVTALHEDGGKLGVSSRGCGTLKMVEGLNHVQDDYHLATAADIVADPSAPDAFVSGIMEGKEWVWDNGIVKEAEIAGYQETIKKANARKLEEQKISVFKRFIESL